MTRNKGRERFIKQCRAMLYNMSTSAGARDGMRYQEYAANVRAQRGFPTRELVDLRAAWVSSGQASTWPEWLNATRRAWESMGRKLPA